MKTPPAPPYLLPHEEAFTPHPWTWPDGVELIERVDHWDPYTDVEMVRVLDIDLDQVRAACSLGPDAAFAITVAWYSNRTRLASESPPVELGTLSGVVRAPLTLRIPGIDAGGRLDVHTRVVLRYAGRAATAISPKRPGATLWHQTSSIRLEGGASRFPITAVEFASSSRLPDRGSWFLEWNRDDLDVPVLGGLRLLLNIQDQRLVNALRSGSRDTRSELVRAFVTYDVARSLVHGALDSDRFVDDAETFDDGSIGRMLFDLLSTFWPGIPVKALRARRVDDPSRLDAEIQAHLGVIA